MAANAVAGRIAVSSIAAIVVGGIVYWRGGAVGWVIAGAVGGYVLASFTVGTIQSIASTRSAGSLETANP